MSNEETPTEELLGEKEIIVSDTDPGPGMLYKNHKEKMFAYNSTIICDGNNYALTVDINPSNMHDSVAFYSAFEKLNNNIGLEDPTYFVGDAAYITPHICKTLIDLDFIPTSMTKNGYNL